MRNHVIHDNEGKLLFTENDILDYIEDKCGSEVKQYVDGLLDYITDLECSSDDDDGNYYN